MKDVKNNYNELASRTEARDFDGKQYSKSLQHEVLMAAINAAKFLDIFKKHFFYNKHYSQKEMLETLDQLKSNLDRISTIDIEKVLNKEIGKEDLITYSKDDINSLRLFHAVLGIMTEGGEIGEAILKAEQGEQLDWVNIAEENGDVDWYQAILYSIPEELGLSITEEEVRTKNIDKLAKRYGDKYSDYRAVNRNLEAERKILEG